MAPNSAQDEDIGTVPLMHYRIDGRTVPMPRFHFNILGSTADPDLEGTEFPTIKAAKREARRYAGTRLSDSALIVDPNDEWRIEITDPTGLVLFQIDVMVTDSPATAG